MEQKIYTFAVTFKQFPPKEGWNWRLPKNVILREMFY